MLTTLRSRFVLGAGILCLAAQSSYSQENNPSKLSQSALYSSPLQREIEKQRLRLASRDSEERRDAVSRLGALKNREGSRMAAQGLLDADPIVRATAAEAVLSEPTEEAAAALLPLLRDRKEFVRREVAYSLGHTKSREAVASLVGALQGDKEASVRAAAAIALGEIRDEAAVSPLIKVFDHRSSRVSGALKHLRGQARENEFVRRAAAHSLGQIRSRAAVSVLVTVLSDRRSEPDVRREAAGALGKIGDATAAPALRDALTDPDPYLSRAALEALKSISPKN